MTNIKLTKENQELIIKAIDYYYDNYFYYNTKSFSKYKRILRKMIDVKNPRLKDCN